jgi:hypothetical protein
MLEVVDPDAGPLEATWPEVAPVATQVEAPAACMDLTVADNVSKTRTNSQDAAFETELSEQPGTFRGSGETDLRQGCARSNGQIAFGGAGITCRRSRKPRKGGLGCHIDGETASTRSGYCSASP